MTQTTRGTGRVPDDASRSARFPCGRLAAALLACCWLGALLAPVAGAEPSQRHLTVAPATGLVDEVVHVSWTGFTPSQQDGYFAVVVMQCKGASPASLDSCHQVMRASSGGADDNKGTALQNGVTGPDGSGSADFEVRPALDLPELDCSTKQACSIVAYENDGILPAPGALPASAVVAPIAVAPSPRDCPKADTPDVTTSGEASSAMALYSWGAKTCTGASPLALDYTETSSPEGRDTFLKAQVDVGITSTAPTTDELAAASRKQFAVAPVDLSGVVVAFAAYDTTTHQRITEMNLSPRLVAILIAGGQAAGPANSLFSDPEFLALNPGHQWPNIVFSPLLRSERNADAYLLTAWLNADQAARKFLDGNDPTAQVDAGWKGVVYPTDVFEVRDPSLLGRYQPRSGTKANARRMFNLQQPGEGGSSFGADNGLLGVFDVVTARHYGMTTARLSAANHATGPFVAADADGLTAGYRSMKSVGTGLQATKIADSTASRGYPLAKVDYAMVPTAGVNESKAAKIAQFLQYSRTDGQITGVLPSGYVPLPDDLTAQNEATQKAVVDGAKPPPADQPRPSVSVPSLGPPAGGTGSPSPSSGGAVPGSPAGSDTGPPADGGTGLPADGGTGLPADNGTGLPADNGGGSGFDGAGGVGSGTVPSDGSGGSSQAFGGGVDSNGQAIVTTSSPPESTQGSSAVPRGGLVSGAGPTALRVGRAQAGRGSAVRAIGDFGGGEGQSVLPVLAALGLIGLTVGPGLTFWNRRKLAKTGGAAGPAPGAALMFWKRRQRGEPGPPGDLVGPPSPA